MTMNTQPALFQDLPHQADPGHIEAAVADIEAAAAEYALARKRRLALTYSDGRCVRNGKLAQADARVDMAYQDLIAATDRLYGLCP
jgi:hypothetical protein